MSDPRDEKSKRMARMLDNMVTKGTAMTDKTEREELAERIGEYLSNGGLFNPDLMAHDHVRDLLIDCRSALTAQPQGEPVAWYVYIPSQQNGYYVDSLDDAQLVDDLTNVADTEVTPLYTAPQPGVRKGIHPLLEVLVKWEIKNGSLSGIVPSEYAGLCDELATVAVEHSPRQITRAAEQINAEGQRIGGRSNSGAANPDALPSAPGQPSVVAAPSAPRAEQTHVSVPVEVIESAVDIYDLMLRCSRSCKPMEHLLTTDGLYALNTADLHVRNDGKEYVMEADWAKQCGKLVKALKEIKDGTYAPRAATISAIGSESAMLRAATKGEGK